MWIQTADLNMCSKSCVIAKKNWTSHARNQKYSLSFQILKSRGFQNKNFCRHFQLQQQDLKQPEIKKAIFLKKVANPKKSLHLM